MNLLQITPVSAAPPVHGSDHRSHGIVSEFPACGSEIRRYTQSLKIAQYRSLDFCRNVTIKEGYSEIRSRNPLFRVIRLTSSVLDSQSASGNLARVLRYYMPSGLARLLDWSDVILVKRSADHVIVLSELAEDNPHNLFRPQPQRDAVTAERNRPGDGNGLSVGAN